MGFYSCKGPYNDLVKGYLIKYLLEYIGKITGKGYRTIRNYTDWEEIQRINSL